MNKKLEQAIEGMRALPESAQGEVGEIVLNVVASHCADAPKFTPEQIEQAKMGFAQIDAGETASQEEVDATFRKHLNPPAVQGNFLRCHANP